MQSIVELHSLPIDDFPVGTDFYDPLRNLPCAVTAHYDQGAWARNPCIAVRYSSGLIVRLDLTEATRLRSEKAPAEVDAKTPKHQDAKAPTRAVMVHSTITRRAVAVKADAKRRKRPVDLMVL